MKIAIKYIKGYPLFYAWNLDNPEHKNDYERGICSDLYDEDLQKELDKYGDCHQDVEGIYNYDTINEFDALISNIKEVVTIQHPTEEEREEFMTDLYTYDRSK